jgi:hypothetical protein
MTTAQEFDQLLADVQAAYDAMAATEGEIGPAYEATGERYRTAYAAVRAARPTDPATMARQLRWLIDEGGCSEREAELALLWIADRLEEMAPWNL